ncbi:MAG: DMT family transporter [Gammaproteobacteria bacterium]
MSAAIKTVSLTVAALIAFAANSILCRLALGENTIDFASFTTIRLVSGAITLWLLTVVRSRTPSTAHPGSWLSAAMLFAYAITFSFAYVTLDVGTGALILFGAVQITMILAGLLAGERPRAFEWLGLAIAIGGLVYLVSPGLTAPSPIGAFLMAISGIAWGVYSLRGRGISDPVAATADNFIRSVPFVLLVSLVMIGSFDVSARGLVLAVLSGALASGLGYVVWYAALKGLTATRAATVQLVVPVIAAAGGALLLTEPVTTRLILASVFILGGVALAVLTHQRATP